MRASPSHQRPHAQPTAPVIFDRPAPPNRQVDHVELEYKSAAANYTSIDMLVRHRGADLALEVDGPWHFSANHPYRCCGALHASACVCMRLHASACFCMRACAGAGARGWPVLQLLPSYNCLRKPTKRGTNRPTIPNRLLGGTVLRNRLLEAEGYTLVSVPFFEWEALPATDAARGQYLQDLVDRAAAGAAEAAGAAGAAAGRGGAVQLDD
jgi:hypothetical protein